MHRDDSADGRYIVRVTQTVTGNLGGYDGGTREWAVIRRDTNDVVLRLTGTFQDTPEGVEQTGTTGVWFDDDDLIVWDEHGHGVRPLTST